MAAVDPRYLAFRPALHDRLREYAAVDLALPVQLGLRENALASSLQKELVLLLAVQVAHPIGVLDQIVIRIRGVILGDALQTVEEASRTDLDESVDADIADIGAVTVVAVANVAMLLDVLTAGAIIPFVADLDSDEIPFLSRCLEIRCDG